MERQKIRGIAENEKITRMGVVYSAALSDKPDLLNFDICCLSALAFTIKNKLNLVLPCESTLY